MASLLAGAARGGPGALGIIMATMIVVNDDDDADDDDADDDDNDDDEDDDDNGGDGDCPNYNENCEQWTPSDRIQMASWPREK